MVAVNKKTMNGNSTKVITSTSTNLYKSKVTEAPMISTKPMPSTFYDIFLTKQAYQYIANDFHLFHQHDMNCIVHVLTTTLGVWGVLHFVMQQLMSVNNGMYAASATSVVYGYMILIGVTAPMVTTIIHTAMIYACLQVTPTDVLESNYGQLLSNAVATMTNLNVEAWHIAFAAIVLGYGLQDLSHYMFAEPTYMNAYMKQGKPYMLLIHSLWLLPLVIDSILIRHFFLPKLFVTRNRNVIVKSVTSRNAVEGLRTWINQNVPVTPETTHVWPHNQDPTSQATVALENDTAIEAAFRTVFPAKHYDVVPVQTMNEIYVTAVGAKKSINSDAVFYTPHTDGPYWFLPYASLYRVLVGVTPNTMVRTRFNLQHSSQDQVLDIYGVVGFDYNRELHWIDHVPNTSNSERRSLLKLHYVVYPKGWHTYGKLCAYLNTSYNTWARGNFLTTLRPSGSYEIIMAWWIWLTTKGNAEFVELIGWDNLVYIGTCSLLGTYPFLILTSFRHYITYITTFAYRTPMVAHGYLMRDAKLYKTISMLHLAKRLLPMVQFTNPNDLLGLAICCCGFALTILATIRLGMVRTYFGTELNFVEPKWIDGFPYGYIPHPMIVGQIIAFTTIMVWWWNQISTENVILLSAHIACYTTHMIQEELTGGY